MLELFNKISDRSKLILVGSLGFAIATLPLSITMIIMNSTVLSLKTDSVEFEVSGKGKELTAVSAEQHSKLQQDFNRLKQNFDELNRAAKSKNVDRVLRPQLNAVGESVDNTKIRLNDVQESNEQLNDFVEETIIEP